ncbi:MAG: glycogen debranching protein GlgX [Kineosporiaceae bacterium]
MRSDPHPSPGGGPAVDRAPARPSPAADPYRLGVRLAGDGIDVAVFAAHATGVEVCLPGPDGAERRTPLTHRVHGIWHGHLPGVRVGDRYGLRVHGPWHPGAGHRHNPHKVLLDPYARALVPPTLSPALFGHAVDDGLGGDPGVMSRSDSAPVAAWGVVVDDAYPWGADTPPRVPWEDTVVYEAHVKGLTMRHPGVPPEIRGTYQALGHPAVLAHLLRLGVTAVELLPVHACLPEPRLASLGLTNYWGYNTLGFFAPDPRYSAAARRGEPPGAEVAEFKTMVKRLHAAGLEVLLDVVHNHTCEGGEGGPTLSWRGLDNASYYRTVGPGYVDTTGTGNSLDFGHPEVVRATLDSLRYWVTEMRVDGFRFDLMTTLGRRRDGEFDPDHPLLVALRTDPVLRGVKLIAEPWDVGPGGWCTGRFPIPLAEWNDRYRDGIRDFWLAGAKADRAGHPGPGVRDLATRLAGSGDLFGDERGPLASVNYVASHDGFTLADLVSYDTKHNEANGEGNRDGHSHDLSDNHGHEGPTDDPGVLAARRATLRALLGTWAVSTGVPMLLAGDETGRTQQGNNNAYCHDSELTWLDWRLTPWQQDLLDTARFLLKLRATHPALRRRRLFTGQDVHPGGAKDLAWFTGDGDEMTDREWFDPHRRTLLMYLHSAESGASEASGPRRPSLLVVVNGGAHDREVLVPERPWAARYRMLWTSAMPRPGWPAGPAATVGAGPSDLRPGDRLVAQGKTVTLLDAELD